MMNKHKKEQAHKVSASIFESTAKNKNMLPS